MEQTHMHIQRKWYRERNQQQQLEKCSEKMLYEGFYSLKLQNISMYHRELKKLQTSTDLFKLVLLSLIGICLY